MTCTWTTSRQYSDYLALNVRGDQNFLSRVYHPSKKGTSLKGEAIYVNFWDSAEFTVASPTCSEFLPGTSCNGQIALTKFLKIIKHCFDDCAFAELTDGDMMALADASADAMFATLLPLIYADIAANGTRYSTGALNPTGAQILAAVNNAIAGIVSVGGGQRMSIIFDRDYAGPFTTAAGGLFQPAGALGIDPGSPKGIIGYYLGSPVYITPSNLVTADATPLNICAFVIDEYGYAFAPSGENFPGTKLIVNEDDENGTNSVLFKYCTGYKIINIQKATVIHNTAS